MLVEKVKRKKNMFDGLFIYQRVSTSILGWSTSPDEDFQLNQNWSIIII